MGLIKKASELDIPTNLKMMIFGSAGAGKTTLGLSAPKPLHLDFDNSIKRVNKEHLSGIDIVQIESWQNCKDLFREDLSGYQTIVVDTVGKMMDFISNFICAGRQPQIKDWAKINAEFSWFNRELSNLNKNIVYIAHRDTRKEGDETVYIPSLREKSYNAIVTELDLLGYLEMKSINGVQTRTITFDPTTRNDGKNTCSLPGVMPIPLSVDPVGNTIGQNNFIVEKILKPYAAMLAKKQDDIKAYNELIEEIKGDINFISNADEANEFAGKVKSYKHIGSSLNMTRELFTAKCNELGLKFNKESKKYESA